MQTAGRLSRRLRTLILSRMSEPIITFFTRENCRLCEIAMAQLETAMGDRPFRLTKVDIDLEREHHEEYKHHIPVIWVNGVEVCRHRLDRTRFLAVLEAAT